MNAEKYIGIFMILFGSLTLIFRNIILKIQGPDRKGKFSLEERRKSLLIGGIGFIIIGIVFILKSF